MAGRLKPLDVEREEKPGKYADGDGLYLIVASATSKNWSYRYWFKGKERWHGLGSFKDVSLREARLVIRHAILALTQFWCSSFIRCRSVWPEADRFCRDRTFAV